MKFFKNHMHEIILVAVSVMCIVLIVCGIVMLSEYQEELKSQASIKAQLYATDATAELKDAIEVYQYKSELAAEQLSAAPATDQDEFLSAIRKLRNDSRFDITSFCRYYKDGVVYSSSGTVYSHENQAVLNLLKTGNSGCAGTVIDSQYNISVVAYVVQMLDGYGDAYIAYYPTEIYDSLNIEYDENNLPDYIDQADLTVLCSAEGEVLKIMKQTDGKLHTHSHIYDYLRDTLNDKSIIDDIQNNIAKGISTVYNTEIASEDYNLTSSCIGSGTAAFSVFCLYKSMDIYNNGYEMITTVITVMLIFLFIIIVLSVYFAISRRLIEKRISAMRDVDIRIDCPTRQKFEHDGKAILAQNKATSFAVVVLEIQHFAYLSEQVSEDTITKLLLYMKLLFKKNMSLNEEYGYMGDGRFVALIHYREQTAMAQRLQTLCQLARNRKDILPASYHLELLGGIYLTDTKLVNDVSKMVDYAIEAQNTNAMAFNFGVFRIYNEKMLKSREMNEYIELNMHKALEQKNFIVFYQPKYNIKNNRPDGAEALVRWYNPETDDYMSPGVFMPLFEANGFVEKLDKTVYEQVCCYLEEATSQGQTVYPISVNVSRVTASRPDFLEYYISRKKAHNIANGFLTIEFTESFAYENYELLREEISTLHANGFLCSIDDFGSGYSSYNILKEIQMDEIKLDQFFIHKGYSAEKDVRILASVINLARELGMKVTQEGVETIDELELLKKLGCQVIQGYHYSKPIHLSDYIDFITKRTKDVMLNQQ